MSSLRRTEKIRYNLADRKREYGGEERSYHIPSAVALINGAQLQAQVRSRDLHGFYSHLMRDPETGDIKLTALPEEQLFMEPAVVTVYLKAYDNGDVEHQQEFTNTKAGKLAWSMHQSGIGGLSAVIPFVWRDGVQYPTGFKGFDYVRIPNFNENRGYAVAMDDIGSGADPRLMAMHLLQSDLLVMADKLQTERQVSGDLSDLVEQQQSQILGYRRQQGVAMDDLATRLSDPSPQHPTDVAFHRQFAKQFKPEPVVLPAPQSSVTGASGSRRLRSWSS